MNRLIKQTLSLRYNTFCLKHISRKAVDTFVSCNFSTSAAKLNTELFRLESRGFVEIKGKHAVSFLQNILTNDVTLLGPQMPIQYAMMLNYKGRVLYEMLLYDMYDEDGSRKILVECDRTLIEDFIKNTSIYKLRKETEIKDVSDRFHVFASAKQISSDDFPKGAVTMCEPDPRVPTFGCRVVSESEDIEGATILPEKHYTLRRYQWGIPEGKREFLYGKAIPLNCNITFMNGVSFSKGCYIGQEVIARAHHTGFINSRMLPFTFTENDYVEEEGRLKVIQNLEYVGRCVGVIGKYGLAIVKHRLISEEGFAALTQSGHVYPMKIKIPDWWPENC